MEDNIVPINRGKVLKLEDLLGEIKEADAYINYAKAEDYKPNYNNEAPKPEPIPNTVEGLLAYSAKGDITLPEESNVFRPAASDLRGIKFKDGYVGVYEDPYQLRFDRQGWKSQAFNGLVGGTISGLAGAVETLAYIPNLFTQDFEQNFIAQTMSEFREHVKEDLLPIYRPPGSSGMFSWDDGAFVWESLRGIVDSGIQFAIPGGIISKGIGVAGKVASQAIKRTALSSAQQAAKTAAKLQQAGVQGYSANKLSKLSQGSLSLLDKISSNAKIANWLNAIPSGMVLNDLEGTLMGIETYENVYGQAIDKGYTKEEAEYYASKAAKDFKFYNRSMIFTDAFGLLGIWGNANKAMNNILRNPSYISRFKNLKASDFSPFNKKFWDPDNLFVQGLKESFEEISQNVFQQEVEFQAFNSLNKLAETEGKDFKKFDLDGINRFDLSSRVFQFATGEQALYEGMLGFFGGGFQRILTQAPVKIMDGIKSRNLNRELETLKKELGTQTTDEGRNTIQRKINNVEERIKNETLKGKYKHQQELITSGTELIKNKFSNVAEALDLITLTSMTKKEAEKKLVEQSMYINMFVDHIEAGTIGALEELIEDFADGSYQAKTNSDEVLDPDTPNKARNLLKKLDDLKSLYVQSSTYSNPKAVFVLKNNLKNIAEYKKSILEDKSNSIDELKKAITNKYQNIKINVTEKDADGNTVVKSVPIDTILNTDEFLTQGKIPSNVNIEATSEELNKLDNAINDIKSTAEYETLEDLNKTIENTESTVKNIQEQHDALTDPEYNFAIRDLFTLFKDPTVTVQQVEDFYKRIEDNLINKKLTEYIKPVVTSIIEDITGAAQTAAQAQAQQAAAVAAKSRKQALEEKRQKAIVEKEIYDLAKKLDTTTITIFNQINELNINDSLFEDFNSKYPGVVTKESFNKIVFNLLLHTASSPEFKKKFSQPIDYLSSGLSIENSDSSTSADDEALINAAIELEKKVYEKFNDLLNYLKTASSQFNKTDVYNSLLNNIDTFIIQYDMLYLNGKYTKQDLDVQLNKIREENKKASSKVTTVNNTGKTVTSEEEAGVIIGDDFNEEVEDEEKSDHDNDGKITNTNSKDNSDFSPNVLTSNNPTKKVTDSNIAKANERIGLKNINPALSIAYLSLGYDDTGSSIITVDTEYNYPIMSSRLFGPDIGTNLDLLIEFSNIEGYDSATTLEDKIKVLEEYKKRLDYPLHISIEDVNDSGQFDNTEANTYVHDPRWIVEATVTSVSNRGRQVESVWDNASIEELVESVRNYINYKLNNNKEQITNEFNNLINLISAKIQEPGQLRNVGIPSESEERGSFVIELINHLENSVRIKDTILNRQIEHIRDNGVTSPLIFKSQVESVSSGKLKTVVNDRNPKSLKNYVLASETLPDPTLSYVKVKNNKLEVLYDGSKQTAKQIEDSLLFKDLLKNKESENKLFVVIPMKKGSMLIPLYTVSLEEAGLVDGAYASLLSWIKANGYSLDAVNQGLGEEVDEDQLTFTNFLRTYFFFPSKKGTENSKSSNRKVQIQINEKYTLDNGKEVPRSFSLFFPILNKTFQIRNNTNLNIPFLKSKQLLSDTLQNVEEINSIREILNSEYKGIDINNMTVADLIKLALKNQLASFNMNTLKDKVPTFTVNTSTNNLELTSTNELYLNIIKERVKTNVEGTQSITKDNTTEYLYNVQPVYIFKEPTEVSQILQEEKEKIKKEKETKTTSTPTTDTKNEIDAKEKKSLEALKDVNSYVWASNNTATFGDLKFTGRDTVGVDNNPSEYSIVSSFTFRELIDIVYKPDAAKLNILEKEIKAKYDAERKALEETQEISDQEYENFINKGIVTQNRINTIAEKIKNNKNLNQKELAIFNGKTAEINNKLAELKASEESTSTETKEEKKPNKIKKPKSDRVSISKKDKEADKRKNDLLNNNREDVTSESLSITDDSEFFESELNDLNLENITKEQYVEIINFLSAKFLRIITDPEYKNYSINDVFEELIDYLEDIKDEKIYDTVTEIEIWEQIKEDVISNISQFATFNRIENKIEKESLPETLDNQGEDTIDNAEELEYVGEEGKSLERYDQVSMQINPNLRASTKLKLKLASIIDGTNKENSVFELGMPMPLDRVFQDIRRELAAKPTENVEEMLDLLFKSKLSHLRYIALTIKEDFDQASKNEFYTVFNLQKHENRLLLWNIDSNGKYNVQYIDSNRYTSGDIQRMIWENNFTSNTELFSYIDNKLHYNVSELQKILAKYEAIESLVIEKDEELTKEERQKVINDLVSVFKDIGVEISYNHLNEMLSDLQAYKTEVDSNQRKVELNNTSLYKAITDPNGFIKTFFKGLIRAGISIDSMVKKTGTLPAIILKTNVYDPYVQSQGDLKNLGTFVSNRTGSYYTDSHRNADNKLVWDYGLYNHLIERLLNIKSGKYNLNTHDYRKNSLFNLQIPNDQLYKYAKSFQEVAKLDYSEGLSKKNSKLGVVFDKMNRKEKLIDQLLSIQYNQKVVTVDLPTRSDKGNPIKLTMPLITSLRDMDLIFIDAIFSEIDLINSMPADPYSKDVVNSSYVEGSRYFYFFPLVNKALLLKEKALIDQLISNGVITEENQEKDLDNLYVEVSGTFVPNVENREKTNNFLTTIIDYTLNKEREIYNEKLKKYNILQPNDSTNYVLGSVYENDTSLGDVNSKFNFKQATPEQIQEHYNAINRSRENLLTIFINHTMLANIEYYRTFSDPPAAAFKPVHKDKYVNLTAEQIAENINSTKKENIKRNARSVAPGEKPSTFIYNPATKKFEFKDDYKVVIVSDNTKGTSNTSINSSPILSKFYKQIDRTDAQEFTTLVEKLNVMFMYGMFETDQDYIDFVEKAIAQANYPLDKKLPENLKFTNKELELILSPKELILSPEKPVQVGEFVSKNGSNIPSSIYIKSSAIPLFRQWTEELDLDNLRQFLETNKIDRIAYKSAVKVGAEQVFNIYNQEGRLKDVETLNEEYTKETPAITLSRNDAFYIQQRVPYDENKNTILTVSQMNKLLFEGILDMQNFKTKDDNGNLITVDGFTLLKRKKEIRKELFRNIQKDILDKFTTLAPGKENLENDEEIYDTNNRVYDIDKIRDVLIREAKRNGTYSKNDLNFLETADGNFLIPLIFNGSSSKFESLVASIINKIVFQKISGKSFVQATGTDIISSKDFDFTNSNIVFSNSYNPKEGLQFVTKDSKTNTINKAQVLIPWDFKDSNGNLLDINNYIDKETNKINFNKLPKEVLTIIGARIPNQSHSSMLAIEVVGFLPSVIKNTIIVPPEITKQMGADFDVDKLYGYMYNYVVEPSGNIRKLNKENLKLLKNNIKRATSLLLDEYDRIKDLEADVYLEEKNKLEKDPIVQNAMTIIGINSLEEIEEFDQKDLLRTLYRDFDTKLLVNEYIDIHESVLTNGDMYEKIVSILDLDDAKEIRDKETQRTATSYVSSIISPSYNEDEFYENKAGKDGVGIMSIASTFNSILLATSKYMEESQDFFDQRDNPTDLIYLSTKETPQDEKVPFNNIKYKIQVPSKGGDVKTIIVTANVLNKNAVSYYKDSSGIFNKRTKGDNITIIQNESVDNAKHGTLGVLNFNINTFGVSNALTLLSGYVGNNKEEQYSVAVDTVANFLMQESIKEYSSVLSVLFDSIDSSYERDKSDLEFLKIYNSYAERANLPGYETINELINNIYTKDLILDTAEELENIKNIENKDQAYYKKQLEYLELFYLLEDISSTIGEAQKSINIDSKGIGKNFAQASIKHALYQDTLNNNMISAKFNIKLENMNALSLTEEGLATEAALDFGIELFVKPNPVNNFSPLYPYSSIINILDIHNKKNKKSKNISDSQLTDFINAYKRFTFANPNFYQQGLSAKEISNALRFGLKENIADLLAVVKTTEWGKNNYLVQRLVPDKSTDLNTDPHGVIYNSASFNRMDSGKITESILEMLNSTNQEEKDFILKLLSYYFSSDSNQNYNNIISYIPAGVYKYFSNELINNYNNLLGFTDQHKIASVFYEQYIQHNPILAKNIDANIESTLTDGKFSEYIYREYDSFIINLKESGPVIDGLRKYLLNQFTYNAASPFATFTSYGSFKDSNQKDNLYRVDYDIKNKILTIKKIPTLGVGRNYFEYNIPLDYASVDTAVSNVNENNKGTIYFKSIDPKDKSVKQKETPTVDKTKSTPESKLLDSTPLSNDIIQNSFARYGITSNVATGIGAIKQILLSIRSDAYDSVNQALSELLLSNIDKLGSNVSIAYSKDLASEGQYTNRINAKGEVSTSPNADLILVKGNYSKLKSFEANASLLKNETQRIILHEILHAFVNNNYYLYKNNSSEISKELKELFKKIENTSKVLKKKLIANDKDLKEKLKTFADKYQRFKALKVDNTPGSKEELSKIIFTEEEKNYLYPIFYSELFLTKEQIEASLESGEFGTNIVELIPAIFSEEFRDKIKDIKRGDGKSVIDTLRDLFKELLDYFFNVSGLGNKYDTNSIVNDLLAESVMLLNEDSAVKDMFNQVSDVTEENTFEEQPGSVNTFTYKDKTIETEFQLSKDQEQALKNLIDFSTGSKKKFVLQGAAGTGKTSIIGYLQKYLNENFLYSAPTHAATVELAIATLKTGNLVLPVTVASMMAKNPKTNKYGLSKKAARKLGFGRIIVVDETSMLNYNDYVKLNDITDLGYKVIFLGDKKQIPEVITDKKINSKNISLAFTENESFSLNTIHRTSNPDIKNVLQKIRDSIVFKLYKLKENTENVQFFNNDLTFRRKFKEFVEKDPQNTDYIAYTNKAVSDMNKLVRENIFKRTGEIQKGDIVMGYLGYASKQIEKGDLANSVSFEVINVDKTNNGFNLTLQSERLLDLRNKGFNEINEYSYTTYIPLSPREALESNFSKDVYEENNIDLSNRFNYLYNVLQEANAKGGTYWKVFETAKLALSDYLSKVDLGNDYLYNVESNRFEPYDKINPTKKQLKLLNIYGKNRNLFVIEKGIDFGHAITVHKSQGRTTKNVFFDANTLTQYDVKILENGKQISTERQSLGYVGMSRASENLFVNEGWVNFTEINTVPETQQSETTNELTSDNIYNQLSDKTQFENVVIDEVNGRKPAAESKNYYEGNIKPEPNTIFVFGSNPEGRHGAGAAKIAKEQFGAIYGQGEGLQGNAYALPTKDLRVKKNNGFKSISFEQIIKNIQKLYEVAKQNPNKQFKIGYRNTTEKSLNGYTGLEMIEMFNQAGKIPSNIVFSKEWIDTGKVNQFSKPIVKPAMAITQSQEQKIKEQKLKKQKLLEQTDVTDEAEATKKRVDEEDISPQDLPPITGVDPSSMIYDIDAFFDDTESIEERKYYTPEDIDRMIANNTVTVVDYITNNPCLVNGARITNINQGGKWKILKDLEGPSHSEGGIDIKINNNGVFINKKGSVIKASAGLVMPNNLLSSN